MRKSVKLNKTKPKASKTWRGHPVYTEEDAKHLSPPAKIDIEWGERLMKKHGISPK